MHKLHIQPISTPGDGNCFYHAIYQAIHNKPSTKEDILLFKQQISQQVTLSNLLLLGHEFQAILYKCLEANKELQEFVDKDFALSLQHPDILEFIDSILPKFKEHIQTDGVWPNDWAQQFCSLCLKYNIIVYMSDCKKMSPIFPIEPKYNCILLFNKQNIHWETGQFQVRDKDTAQIKQTGTICSLSFIQKYL